MYLFCSRISKLSVRRNNYRYFSSLPVSPYLLNPSLQWRESPEGLVVNSNLFNPAKKNIVYRENMFVSKELLGIRVGISQGWVASLGIKDLKVYLTDLYKPWVSSPRVISLPSLGYRPSINNTAVSLYFSDPLHNDDVLVVGKFDLFYLSVCRPTDSKWTHINSPKSEGLLAVSNIIYSKRDKAFYFTSVDRFCLGSVDLSNNEFKYHILRLRNLPKISKAGWKMLHDNCFLSKHLVESPSGELFFIMWYTKCIRMLNDHLDKWQTYLIEPKQFMVFREDEKSKEFCYTEDIGDLCIFLGSRFCKTEDFCVSATMYGLMPNSIYYTGGPGAGSFNLASGKARPLCTQMFPCSYWLSDSL